MEALLERGSQCFANRNYRDALNAYSEAVATEPTNARAWSNQSACYAKLEQFAEALQAADKALFVDASFTKAHGRRAAALQGLKRYEEAVGAFETALRHDPANAVYRAGIEELKDLIRQRRGVVGSEAKDRFYFDKSLKEGKDAMVKGELHEAIRHFTRALDLCPTCGGSGGTTSNDEAVLLCNRSAAYYRLERWDASLQDADAAVAVGPLYARAHLRRAMSLRRVQRLDDAKVSIDRCLSIDPSNSMAQEEAASIDRETAERDKSNAARVEEQRQRMTAAASQRVEQAQQEATAQNALRRQGGPAHATTYVYCSFCNTYGHERSECPVMRHAKKRPRD